MNGLLLHPGKESALINTRKTIEDSFSSYLNLTQNLDGKIVSNVASAQSPKCA